MVRTAVKPYVMTDFKSLTEGARFVLAYEYGNTQDELPIGLDWQQIYAQLSKSELTKGSPFRPFTIFDINSDISLEMVKFQDAGLLLSGRGTMAVDPREKVISGPPMKELSQFGKDLPPDSVDLLKKILAAGAYRVDLDRVISPHNVLRSLLGRPDIMPAFHRGFVSEYSGKVSLTNLGVLRALQELDKE
jgi:hypothetical protein